MWPRPRAVTEERETTMLFKCGYVGVRGDKPAFFRDLKTHGFWEKAAAGG